jgi:hypothetical protein
MGREWGEVSDESCTDVHRPVLGFIPLSIVSPLAVSALKGDPQSIHILSFERVYGVIRFIQLRRYKTWNGMRV